MKIAKKLIFIFSLLIIYSKGFAFEPYATHVPALIVAVVNTNGPILEMGCGHYSTPILHAICSESKRYLLSVESNEKWLARFLYLQTPWHAFQYIPVYAKSTPNLNLWDFVGNDTNWDVIFIDHTPEKRRKVDIARLRDHTKIFVVHDTEAEIYEYEDVLSSFKYRYDYKIYPTYTTLVSDTVDVNEFFQ